MKYCQNCGSSLSDESLFCSSCGSKVNGKNTKEIKDRFYLEVARVGVKVKSFKVKANEPLLGEIKQRLEAALYQRVKRGYYIKCRNYFNRYYTGKSFKIKVLGDLAYEVLREMLEENGFNVSVESQGSDAVFTYVTYIVTR